MFSFANTDLATRIRDVVHAVVGEFHAIVCVDEHVVEVQIAMHDAATRQIVERHDEFRHESQQSRLGHALRRRCATRAARRLALAQHVAQRSTVVLRHEEDAMIVLAANQFDRFAEMRMRQRAQKLVPSDDNARWRRARTSGVGA